MVRTCRCISVMSMAAVEALQVAGGRRTGSSERQDWPRVNRRFWEEDDGVYPSTGLPGQKGVLIGYNTNARMQGALESGRAVVTAIHARAAQARPSGLLRTRRIWATKRACT